MRLTSLCVTAALVAACGGSSFTAAPGDGGSGGDGGGAADSGKGDGGSSGDAASMGDGGNGGIDGGIGTSDGASTEAGPQCPDERGKYTLIASGAGCGDLSMSAPQCITQSACIITFLSASAGGAGRALNGAANLAGDGSFMDATIREGTIQRTGCT